VPLNLNDAPEQSSREVVERFSLDNIADALRATADRWVPALFPQGRRGDDRKTWRVASIKGGAPKKQGSCVIQLSGDNAGDWIDWDNPNVLKGGPISTVKEALGLSDRETIPECLKIIEEHGGSSYLHGRAERPTPAKRDRSVDINEAKHTWDRGVDVAGTLAEVYLQARGIAIGPAVDDLRFNENTTNWTTRRAEPALIALFRYPDSTPTGGIHRIYLKHDGSGHAGKKMLGPAMDGVVMLAQPEMSDGTLLVGEGIESTLAAMQLYQRAGWAAASDGSMRKLGDWLREHPETAQRIKRLLVCADKGEAGERAGGALYAAATALGIPTVLCIPKGGDDFADDLIKGLAPDPVALGMPMPATTAQEHPGEPEGQEILLKPTFETIRAKITTLASIDRTNEAVRHASTTKEIIYDLAVAQLDPAAHQLCINPLVKASGVKPPAIEAFIREIRGTLNGTGTAVEATNRLTSIVGRYVFVKGINAMWDREIRTIMPFDAVRRAHWHEMDRDESGEPADPFEVLVKGMLHGFPTCPCDKVDAIGFMPGADEIYPDDGAVTLNTWIRPTIEAIPGDVTIFIEHVAYILDQDQIAIDWLLDFLAHLIQRPHIKIKSAPLIIGAHGIGKSLIGDFMMTLVGRKNTTTVEDTDLSNPHNEWADGTQLVVIGELMNMDRQGVMNRLKSYITDPDIRINRKNIPTYKYTNRMNFIMFSNYRNAARIEKGDRRYFIWISNAQPKGQDYYSTLTDNWFGKTGEQPLHGASHLLHYLQNRPLDHFNHNAPPPVTQAKEQVIGDSRTSIEAYLQELFDAGEAPFQHDLVVIGDAIDYLTDRKQMKTTHKVVSGLLRQNGATELGQIRIANRKPRVWAIHNAAEWAELKEAEIERAFRDPYSARLSDAERDYILGRTFGAGAAAH
jgi:hypothetical protein